MENIRNICDFCEQQYSKLAKGIVRNEDKADAGEHFSMTPLPSASGGGGTALTQDDKNGKPITKWRRICKCFIGLKITKKHKVIH